MGTGEYLADKGDQVVKLKEASLRYRKHMAANGPDFGGEPQAAAYERHCVKYFDAVVAALNETICIIQGEESCPYCTGGVGNDGIHDDTCKLKVLNEVLARAENVE
jgi:hypothetical protein